MTSASEVVFYSFLFRELHFAKFSLDHCDSEIQVVDYATTLNLFVAEFSEGEAGYCIRAGELTLSLLYSTARI